MADCAVHGENDTAVRDGDDDATTGDVVGDENAGSCAAYECGLGAVDASWVHLHFADALRDSISAASAAAALAVLASVEQEEAMEID